MNAGWMYCARSLSEYDEVTRPMNTNPMNYLFAAYLAIWIILAVYLFSIHSREKRLRVEVQRLKQIIERGDGKRG